MSDEASLVGVAASHHLLDELLPERDDSAVYMHDA